MTADPAQSAALRKRLLDGIEEFAEEHVGNKEYEYPLPKSQKIIHDPVWGTIRLHPWEVAVLNLPLFQRLRQIRQTSLVCYVFPGCNHTRFEHTLGVLQQSQRLADAVNDQYDADKIPFDNNLLRDIRLAALFHDCGHSCFSHISEEVYEFCPDIQALFSDPDFPKCNPHEALSALILKSKPVRKFLQRLETKYNVQFGVDRAANWIMGENAADQSSQRFVTQVINGPFDADKLDYIFRDSHYSGIPLGLDLYRLWATCKVSTNPDTNEKILVLHQASVAPLEQILFNKTNLFAIVYQHPKVRAAEKMFHLIVEYIRKHPKKCFESSGRKIPLKNAVDFLWFTDDTFFAEALRRPRGDELHKLIHAIRYRRLFVRALTISHDTVERHCSAGYLQFRKLNQKGEKTYKARRELAQAIAKKAGTNAEKVWVDVPGDPRYGEADRTYVSTSSGSLRKVSDLFPVHYWSDLFEKHKWRAHVFCPPAMQQRVYEAALHVFEESYQIQFHKSAGTSSHVPNAHEVDAKKLTP